MNAFEVPRSAISTGPERALAWGAAGCAEAHDVNSLARIVRA